MMPPKDEFELEFWRSCDREQYIDTTYPKVFQIWEFQKSDSILEVGTGPLGGILPYMQGRLKIGIDPLYWLYEKEKFLLHYPDIFYVQGRAEDISFLKQFTTIVSLNALDHGNSDFHSLENLSTLLVLGGRMYIHVHLRELHQLNIGHDHQLKMEDFYVIAASCRLQIISETIYESDPLESGSPYKTLMAILEQS